MLLYARGIALMSAHRESSAGEPAAAESPAPSVAARTIIERLIAFTTVSRDSNLGLIESARDFLISAGRGRGSPTMPAARKPICSPRSAIRRNRD